MYAVETLDSVKKADLLDKAREAKPTINVFVQINTSEEDQKNGIDAPEAESLCSHILQNCPHLKLMGLMTIGSLDASRATNADTNPDYEILRRVKEQIDAALHTDLELSMGMSDDFERAIRAGSTNVRVGSKIFGARPPKAT